MIWCENCDYLNEESLMCFLTFSWIHTSASRMHFSFQMIILHSCCMFQLQGTSCLIIRLIIANDPETKQQSMQWKSTSSPRPKKARMSYSKLKATSIVFFDIQGIVMAEWVPSGHTVNRQYYIEVFTKLRELVRRKRPELWRNRWNLHQDNTPAHNTLPVKEFLANKNITVLEHPLYSPDLAPCDFYLFPKISQCSKEPILCR